MGRKTYNTHSEVASMEGLFNHMQWTQNLSNIRIALVNNYFIDCALKNQHLKKRMLFSTQLEKFSSD